MMDGREEFQNALRSIPGHDGNRELNWRPIGLEWQPIETAPKDGTKFLGFGGSPDHYHDEYDDTRSDMAVMWWDDYAGGGWRFCSYDGKTYGEWDDPTHWMLLPAVPQTTKPSGV